MTNFKKIFTAPSFDDESKTQQAYLLHVILWTLIVLPIPFLLYSAFVPSDSTPRILIEIGIGTAVNLFLLFIIRRGYIRTAAIIQLITFWSLFTITAITGAGIQSIGYSMGYMLVIIVAGILLGGKGAAITTLLMLASGWFITYAQINKLLIPTFDNNPLTHFMVSLVLFPVVATLQYLSARITRSALERAQASEEKYRLISQVSTDYTFSTELDSENNMHLNWIAGAFESMTGYTYKEYVAAGGWFAHLHPDDIEKDVQAVAKLKSNQPVVHDVRTYTKRKDLQWVRVYGHPVWNRNENRLVGIFGAVQEITEQKKADELEQSRRAMLEKLVKLGQSVTEVSGLYTTIERIWHGVHELGFDRPSIWLYNPERKSMDGTFGTNNQGQMSDEWSDWISLEQDSMESKSLLYVLESPNHIFLTHDFENDYSQPLNAKMVGVKDHAAIGAWAGEKQVAIIAVDNLITSRPITYEQLEVLRLFAGYAGLAIQNARLNSALAIELSQRKKFIVELETKNAELERFTYTVSHDLKSPLVTIRGFLGYLEKDAQEGDFEKFRHDKERIETAVEKMQILLKDLLELSRIGKLMGTLVETPFDELVKEALENVDGQIKGANVLVDHKPSAFTIKCDRVRLIEVLQNLIDNAVKFMGTQPSPQIEIGAFINNENKNVFYVKDNGIGIAPEFHEKIFGLFDKLTSQSEGSGIGLALVKRIIEIHGGRIWIESQVGMGTTFYFTI